MNNETVGFVDVYDIWYQPWWHSTTCYAIIIILICLCLIIVAFWLHKSGWFQKKLSIEQQALQDVHALQIKTYTSDEMIREAYFHLTMILKNYLASVLQLPLLDKTDMEVTPLIKGMISEQLQPLLAEFFERSFQIKFARDKVLDQTLMDDIQFVQDVIKKVSGDFEKMGKI